jgi:hypothetical protein
MGSIEAAMATQAESAITTAKSNTPVRVPICGLQSFGQADLSRARPLISPVSERLFDSHVQHRQHECTCGKDWNRKNCVITHLVPSCLYVGRHELPLCVGTAPNAP